MNRDPLREDGGINLYGFVGGNPVNWVDPWGLEELPPTVIKKGMNPTIAHAYLKFLQGINTLCPFPLEYFATSKQIANITRVNPVVGIVADVTFMPRSTGGKPIKDKDGQNHYPDEQSYWDICKEKCMIIKK